MFIPLRRVEDTQMRMVNSTDVDAEALATELRRVVDGEVRFDAGSRALYSTDGSNYRQVPIGVVLPRTDEDVIETVRLCRSFGAPVLARGGGTSLCGQCCNVAVVLDFSKYMNRILELDVKNRFARVQPGVVLDDLRDAAAREEHAREDAELAAGGEWMESSEYNLGTVKLKVCQVSTASPVSSLKPAKAL